MMTLLQRLRTSFRHQGPWATVVKFYAILADRWQDFRYGLDTAAGAEPLTITGENRGRSFGYQPTRAMPLRRLFRLLQPVLPPDRVLVDLGCGKGRVLLVATEFGFREARGVEFARELCEIAKKNCEKLLARTRTNTRCRIIEADAALYEIQADENVFFMFNPFDEVVLERVLGNIAASWRAAPRKILIIYYNPKCAQVIEQQPEFTRLRQFDFWGFQFTVYASRD
jgi:SAM-dependent methyltransferase